MTSSSVHLSSPLGERNGLRCPSTDINNNSRTLPPNFPSPPKDRGPPVVSPEGPPPTKQFKRSVHTNAAATDSHPSASPHRAVTLADDEGDDDDDELELSSVSDDDDSEEEIDNSSSTGRLHHTHQSSSARGQPSSGSYAGSVSTHASPVSARRKQSTVTQELLANAQLQSQRLQSGRSQGGESSRGSEGSLRHSPQPIAPATKMESTHSVRRLSDESLNSNNHESPFGSFSSGATKPAQKRQSIADIRKALGTTPDGIPALASSMESTGDTSHALSPRGSSLKASGSVPVSHEESKMANMKVRKFVAEIRDAIQTFRKETGIGGAEKRSIGDAAFEEMKRAREVMEAVKRQGAAELLHAGKNSTLTIDTPDLKKLVSILFEELVREGDRHGNAEVVEAMVTSIASVDFAATVLLKRWHIVVCSEGYPRYLDLFLGMQRVAAALSVADITQLLQSASSHPVYRVDLLAAVLRHCPYCPAGAAALEEMTPQYQDAFERAVSTAKAGPMEDRSRRMALVDEAIRCGIIDFSTRDGSDKQTVFSRAAREGDVELVTAIVNRRLLHDVNRVQPDGTNALQQAAARGHAKVVDILCRLSQIAPSLTHVYPGRGNAYELALNGKTKGAAAIADVIKRRMVELRVFTEETDHHGQTPSGSPTVPLERRQSKAEFARKKSISLGAEKEDEVQAVNGVIDGTNIVNILLTAIKPLYEQIKYEESFDPKGDALRKLGILKTDLAKAKDAMTFRLSKLEPSCQIEIRKEAVRNDFLDLVDRLVHETSKFPGNLQLFDLCIRRTQINFDFANISVEKDWFSTAAHNGSTEYLAVLFSLPNIKEHNLQSFQTKRMFEGAVSSSIYRIDSLLFLFSMSEVLNLDYFQVILRPIWQQAFEDIASNARSRPQEQRGNRMQLLMLMVEHPLVQANPEIPSPQDKHTTFSRACAEGDAMLVFFLLNPSGKVSGGGAPVKNPNAVVASSMTGLMHACAQGHVNVVEIFIQLKSVRPEGEELIKYKVSQLHGNAADAAARNGHRNIVALLKGHGVFASPLNGSELAK